MILISLIYFLLFSIIFFLLNLSKGICSSHNDSPSYSRFTIITLKGLFIYLSHFWFDLVSNPHFIVTILDTIQIDIALLTLYLLILLYSTYYIYYITTTTYCAPDYLYYLLCITFSIFILLSTLDQLTLLVAFETINFKTYLLIYFHRAGALTSLPSTTIYYFILSVISSCLFISGLVLLYLHSGSFYFHTLSLSLTNHSIYSLAGLFFIFLFVSQKAAMSPTFSWAISFYPDISYSLLIYLLIIPKFLILYLLYLYYSLASYPLSQSFLLFFGIFNMLIGTLGLFKNNHPLIFILFSSLNHMGWALVALSSSDSSFIYFFYLFVYFITTASILLLFDTFSLIASPLGSLPTSLYSLSLFTRQFPFLTFFLGISFLSTAGHLLIRIIINYPGVALPSSPLGCWAVNQETLL